LTDLNHSIEKKASLLQPDARTRRRNAAETRFKAYGIVAIAIGLLMLMTLVFNIVTRGAGAYQQTFVTLEVELLADKLDKKGNGNLEDIKKVSTFGYAPLLKNAFTAKMADAGIETDLKSKKLVGILSKSAAADVRDFVLQYPERIGETIAFEFLASSRVDG
jgi:phosphate transport system permease protein